MRRLLVLLAFVACGNSTARSDGGGPGGPIPLATLDDVCDGMAGLTGRALLAKVAMPTKGTFTYFAKGDAGTPSPSPSPFTLDVAYTGGAITCTPHSNPPPGSDAPSLPATVRVVVTAGFKTDDGTFAESGLSGFLDGTASFIQFAAGEPFSAIKGTHKTTLTGYQTLTLSVAGSFGAMAPSGTVSEGGSNGSTGATSPVGAWK